MDYKTLLLMEILECGYSDIELLKDIDQDVLLDAINEAKHEGIDLLELNSIVYQSFVIAIDEIEYEMYVKYGKYFKLYDGFSSFHNYIDTHAYLHVDKTELKQEGENGKMIVKEIAKIFEDKTGFVLELQ
mgnify:CR=1 FL=1